MAKGLQNIKINTRDYRMNSTVGLTLGKFAPLHLGHQHMIETAIDEMDHVIVVIYDSPEVTDIPLNKRADWIRNLYPAVEIIEGWNSPNDMGDTPEIKKIQEDYIQPMYSALIPVSYTHLTLPTICSVQISVVAVSLKKKKIHKLR
eukprot:TRINITY_DN12415_c0_g1_i2.p5 TRINITY_DN12415_c0_g1~~TRINITY_DN12415_c0_g1_i2.p5  ORF type:complete len:146 (-),score=17.90 TRINITY_DN12415_c0_g1_i2:43-480(-)